MGTRRDNANRQQYESGSTPATSTPMDAERLPTSRSEPAKTGVALEQHVSDAEDEVRLLAARYTALIAATGEWVWRTDARGQVVEDIPVGRAYTGQSAEAIQGMGWADAIHPDDRERVLASWQHAVATGMRYETMQRVRGADGVYRHFLVRGAPVRGPDGQIMEWVGVTTDVTEQQMLQERLHASEERYRAIFEQAASGIAIATLDGRFAGVNRRFCELVGYSAEELEALTWRDITHPDDIALDESYVEQLLAGTLSEYTLEKRYVRKDGQVIWVQFFTTIVREWPGPSQVLVGIVQDVTKRRRIEEERDYTLNIVSHELKTPLTSLYATLQMLQRRSERGQAIEPAQLERLVGLASRMTRMVDDLLDTAHIESGKVGLSLDRVNLADVCRHITEEQALASARSITLDLPDRVVEVTADPMRVGQVLVNLLSNALKYSPTDRPVILRVRQKGDIARVEVIDRGPGIAPEARARLFERAYRVPGVEVLHGSGVGLGLGLYITRRLVELQGGQIGVRSRLGKGSTFWFTLPCPMKNESLLSGSGS